MKKINKRRIVAIAIIWAICCSCIPTMPVAASDNANLSTEALYDLEKGGTQTFKILDKENNIIDVTIKEVLGKNKVANGTYEVEYSSLGCWRAGFKVDVLNNKFEAVYSSFCVALIGSIRNRIIHVESPTSIVYRFNYIVGAIGVITGFQTVISGNTLKAMAL